MNNMVVNGACVRNGEGVVIGGYRQVVVTDDATIRPVCKVVRKGNPGKRATYQVPHVGDIVIGIRWYPERYYICIMEKEGLRELPQQEARAMRFVRLIQSLPMMLMEWLHVAVGEPAYLPDTCGWYDEMTTHDFNKRDSIFQFFKGCEQSWLDALWKEAKVSPYHVLPQKWELASPMPWKMDNHHVDYQTSFENVKMYTQWVLWRVDGRVDVFTPPPTLEEIGGTLPLIIPSRTERPPMDMPVDIRKAVKIVRGAFRDNKGNSYGCCWSLFAY